MENIIKSNNIELKSRNKGAELFSVIVDGDEYIWNKKEIWAKSSPILFPFVGALKNNKFIYKNKEYIINTKHGFARDSEFLLLEKKENKISYILTSNENTKKMYPFDFDFIVSYEIIGKNNVMMSFEVKNKGDETMYFSLGAHPAFYIPNDYNESYIKIDKKQNISSMKLVGPLISNDETIDILKNTDRINISDDLFKIDTIILDANNINESILADNKTTRKIKVKHKGFPYIAYWRPQKAQFLCIEPWYGISDTISSKYILEEKKGIEKLEKDAIFNASIIFNFEK